MKFIRFFLLNTIIILLLLVSQSLIAQIPPDDYDIESRQNIKCGTFQNNPKVQKLKDRILGTDTMPDYVSQMTYLSPSRLFLIHYDTTGFHAVSTEDLNGNGVPDYIDSVAYYFDYTYRVEVDTMGYQSPIQHFTYTPEDAYQVYVMELGNTDGAYYGETPQDKQLPSNGGFERYSSYIKIDNNYSPTDSTYNDQGIRIRSYYTTGIAAMKITVAHEFHHAIQYVYGMDPNSITIAEMSSTFMEFRLHPDTKDYYQFLYSLFRHFNTYYFSANDGQVGYRYGIFGQFLYKYYADSAMKRMWEIIGHGIISYIALDSCLKERNSSLANAWHEFMPWLYYTGLRTIPGKYFTYANEFPMVTFLDSARFTYPSIMEAGGLHPLEIHPMLFYLPGSGSNTGGEDDAVAGFLTNTELSGPLITSHVDSLLSYNIVITSTMLQGEKQIGNTSYYYQSDNPYGFIFDTLFINSIVEPAYVFPDPYNPNTDPELYLPAPANIVAGSMDKVAISIYNADMLQVFSGSVSPVVLNTINAKSYKVLPLTSLPSSITSGVYIYKVKYGDTESFGKFAVRR